MKAVLPVAGKGTRLRPHTYAKSKGLVTVAGEEVLSHIIKRITVLNIDEIIFVVDENGYQIQEFMEGKYPQIKTKYVFQKEKKGPAHAVYLTKEFFDENEDILIVFNDSICETNYEVVNSLKQDGIIWVKEVENPQRFGIVVLDNDNNIEDMEEKPDNPRSNLAMVGMYYFKNNMVLFSALETMINDDSRVKGEFYLPPAFKLMMKDNISLTVSKVKKWLDCGKPDTLLITNRNLLKRTLGKHERTNAVIVEPIYIGNNVKIENCCIGPNVSIGDNCEIYNSVISESIIGNDVLVENSVLTESIIGSSSVLKNKKQSYNIGENTSIIYRGEEI